MCANLIGIIIYKADEHEHYEFSPTSNFCASEAPVGESFDINEDAGRLIRISEFQVNPYVLQRET